jgi:dipeptidyl aminopeptidase/acylaminoacyl peptidase
MTVWLAGHYGGWKAAVAGAAVTDWADQYNLSDSNVTRGEVIGGSTWVGDNMKKYIDQSPITEAKNIKAPTLILANTGDPRVPITQSYKLYHYPNRQRHDCKIHRLANSCTQCYRSCNPNGKR